MHSSILGRPRLVALALVLMLTTLWLSMRGYHGLTGDAQLYAFQAMARLHPYLSADLFLRNTTQDQFTIFSPLYAFFIAHFGLEDASRILLVSCTVWWWAATFSLARILVGREAAWLATAFLLIVAGDYGGAGVFKFAEPYLTARLPAEALTITALACRANGSKWLDISLSATAMLVHPLMALPGLICLVCLRLPNRVAIGVTAAGILTSLAIAASGLLSPMDASWTEVVRERSQFLFPSLWSIHDWDVNIRSFVSLAVTGLVVPDARTRRFCLAAALVGAGGLSVALIGSSIGPIAVFMQGQAWRWIWITIFMSAAFLPYTAWQIGRDPACGALCALLLICGWTLADLSGTLCISLALLLWVVRGRIDARIAALLRFLAIAAAIAAGVWILGKSWPHIAPQLSISAGSIKPSAASVKPPSSLTADFQYLFGLRIPAAVFGMLLWWWIRSTRNRAVPALVCTLLVAVSTLLFPAAFKQSRTFASPSANDEFSAWRKAIPGTSTVLVTPSPDVGAFVWFTLDRPNYLALDQSAGVVFSRATALEVKRRSQILQPLLDPDWKILSRIRARTYGKQSAAAATRPLTAQALQQICEDPQLGFVISRESVGFGPLPSAPRGAWKDWKLYSCRAAVRRQASGD